VVAALRNLSAVTLPWFSCWFSRQPRAVGQGQVPEPRVVRGRRLGQIPRAHDRGSGRCCWRITHQGQIGVCRSRWSRHQQCRAGATIGIACNRSPPPRRRSTWPRLGPPLVLSRVHWVRPELVAEVKYLHWTDDDRLRQMIYQGLREDKDPTASVAPSRTHRRPRRQPKLAQRPSPCRGVAIPTLEIAQANR
jgi:hypothetical protein